MPDDKSKVGEPDRSKVAANQDYEVSQLAQKHGLTQQQAKDLERHNTCPGLGHQTQPRPLAGLIVVPTPGRLLISATCGSQGGW